MKYWGCTISLRLRCIRCSKLTGNNNNNNNNNRKKKKKKKKIPTWQALATDPV